MNRIFPVFLFLCVCHLGLQAQETFTVGDVIQRSQSQSPDFKQSETRRENRYWQYRLYKSNYNPQVRLNTNTAGLLYNNSFSRTPQPDGSIKYVQVNQFNPGINLALQQPIQWTGGTVSVNTNYNYFQDRTNVSPSQWNGSVLGIMLDQPIFSFNQLKWDRRTEPIRYEESRRDYAESMEMIATNAVTRFFDVLGSQIDQQIAEYNLANNDTIYKIEQGRYNIGTTSLDKLLQVELQLLRSRQDVAQAKLNLQTNSLLLRSYLGLRNGESFNLVLPADVPVFEVNEEEALGHAKSTRSSFIAFERRKIEAEREVARAKGSRYTVGINGIFGLNQQGNTIGELYQNPSQQRIINLTLDVPLIDWGRRKATMKFAYANRQLQDYLIAQDEAVFEQEILTQVRQFEMLQLQIQISKKADEVAFERYNVAQNRYLIGKIDITNLNIALKEKDDAKRSYLQSLRSFWIAYYNLRRLTLFDFVERKYLYNPLAPDTAH